MLNRRHIRAKVMQVLYANKSNTNTGDLNLLLRNSIQDMYKLYLLLLSLLIDLRLRAINYQKKSQQKHLKTKEDILPNFRFVDNILLKKLYNDDSLKYAFETQKIQHWKHDSEYAELIYKDVTQSDIYKAYMRDSGNYLKNDIFFVVEIFKNIIAPNNKLYDYFQDKNITWVDDFPVVNTFILKLFKKITLKLDEKFFTPSLFKDKDDEFFGFNLMDKTLKNTKIYNTEIISKTKNWDKDRIANIDLILLQMAICEFQEFPSIPIKVTINEYIELAKEYSTPKSNIFINGVLDKIVNEYRENKTLNKKGRGLM